MWVGNAASTGKRKKCAKFWWETRIKKFAFGVNGPCFLEEDNQALTMHFSAIALC